jgi:hypothetical protein
LATPSSSLPERNRKRERVRERDTDGERQERAYKGAQYLYGPVYSKVLA